MAVPRQRSQVPKSMESSRQWQAPKGEPVGCQASSRVSTSIRIVQEAQCSQAVGEGDDHYVAFLGQQTSIVGSLLATAGEEGSAVNPHQYGLAPETEGYRCSGSGSPRRAPSLRLPP